MDGFLKKIRDNLTIIILAVTLIGSWFIMKSTQTMQGEKIKELEKQTTSYIDRLARLETKVDMILELLKKK